MSLSRLSAGLHPSLIVHSDGGNRRYASAMGQRQLDDAQADAPELERRVADSRDLNVGDVDEELEGKPQPPDPVPVGEDQQDGAQQEGAGAAVSGSSGRPTGGRRGSRRRRSPPGCQLPVRRQRAQVAEDRFVTVDIWGDQQRLAQLR